MRVSWAWYVGALLLHTSPCCAARSGASSSPARASTPAVTITNVNGTRADPDGVYYAGAVVSLEGTVQGLAAGESVWCALRRQNTGTWRTSKCLVARASGDCKWTAVVALPPLSSSDDRVELIVAVPRQRSVPVRVAHEALARYFGTPPGRILIKGRDTWRHFRPPARRHLDIPPARRHLDIRLTRIGERPAVTTGVMPVAREEEARGEARGLPRGAYVYAVVHPLEGDEYWVQDPTHVKHGRWKGPVLFGRLEGKDRFKRFHVFLVATRQALFVGVNRAKDWKDQRFIAISPAVTAIRVVQPGGVGVSITDVDGETVSPRGVWPAENGCRIEGSIEFSRSSDSNGKEGTGKEDPDKQMPVVLVGALDGTHDWKVVATAFVTESEARWLVYSAPLDWPGKYVKIVAWVLPPEEKVAQLKPGGKWNPYSQPRAISQQILLRIEGTAGGPTAAPTPGGNAALPLPGVRPPRVGGSGKAEARGGGGTRP